MKVLIVEDELRASLKLEKLIKAYSEDIQVLSRLDSVEDTVQWLQQHPQPDLIFLDIHLSDGNSFQIFERAKVSSPIIFTTAFDEYAVNAFRVNSIDYILKPVTAESIRQSFEKLDKLKESIAAKREVNYSALQLLVQQRKYKDRFMVKSGNKIMSLPTDRIAYFTAEEGVNFITTRQGLMYITEYSLDALEDLLSPHHFFRTNRHCLLSIDTVTEVQAYFKGRLKVIVHPPLKKEIIISSQKANDFKEWLGK